MPLAADTWVILRDSRQTQHVVQVPKQGGSIRLTKVPPIPADVLQTADILWTLEYDKSTQKWQRLPEEQLSSSVNIEEEIEANNQELMDDTANQVLSPEQVELMQAEGKSGAEIISALVKGSSTFDMKTPMAQQKWLQKKKRKHLITVTLLPVTLAALCEKYAMFEYRRSAGLRWDYLYTMVGFTGICPGTRVLLVDQSMGLLSGAVIDRLAGNGMVFRINGNKYSSRVLDFMDFDRTMLDQLVHDIPLDLFLEMMEMQTIDDFRQGPANTHFWLRPPAPVPCDPPTKKRKLEDKPIDEAAKIEKKKTRLKVLETLFTQGVDVIIAVISTLKHPGASASEIQKIVSQAAKRFLVSDGKLAVFSLDHTVVLNAQLAAIESGDYVATKFQELFLREHQVLPLRTHPIMASSVRHFAGFLFFGIKVAGEI